MVWVRVTFRARARARWSHSPAARYRELDLGRVRG